MDAVVGQVVLEQALFFRGLQVLQPLPHRLAVEHGLARHPPLPQAIDHVVVLVGLLEALQGGHRLGGEKAVIFIGALVHRGPGVFPVEKPLFQPVGDADGVEGEDHLEILVEIRSQTDVQLVEVPLLQLGGLLNPDAGDVEDGFQLLHIVQPGKEDDAAIGKGDGHGGLVGLGPGVGVEVRNLAHQLGPAALPQGAGHLAAHQPPVPRLAGHPLQHLAPGENALAAAAAPFQHQKPVLVKEEGEKGVVVGLFQALVPQQSLLLSVMVHGALAAPPAPPPTVPGAEPASPGW